MPTTTTTPTPTTPTLRRAKLGGIASTTPSSKSGKTYPVLPDPSGEIGLLVDSLRENLAHLDALEGQVTTDKAELTALAKQFFFEHYQGKGAIESSVELLGASGTPIRIALINKYSAVTDESAVATIAGDRLNDLFYESFSLSIKGEEIPEAVLDPLLEDLQAVFAKHGCPQALTAKSLIKPKKDFHTLRHTLFTPEQNLELDRLCPVQSQVKTKLGKNEH